MSFEILRSRQLTDEEIREIEMERRADALLDEIRDEVIYKNRNNPAFAKENLSRRRLLGIAAGVAGLSVPQLLTKPAMAASYDELAQNARLLAKFTSSQPELNNSYITAGQSLAAWAKLRSVVDYPQEETIGTAIYSNAGGVEDTKYFPHSLPAYTENEFSCELDFSPSIFGYKICLFRTKLSYIYRQFSVRA